MSAAERALEIHARAPDRLLTVVGPTASGKTALAVALAERLGGEVVSADSVQVYRGFDVGSGKPTAEELARAPHHLVSVRDPLSPMDASAWAADADACVADVRARGRVPIVCGGSFLWVKALLWGLASAPAAPAEIREVLRRDAARDGIPALHAELARVDPALAARLHPNDGARVLRGLEVFRTTGRPMSALQAEHGFAQARHPASLVAVAVEPADLTERITGRVRAWLAGGWIEEVEALRAGGQGEARALGSVGYAQVARFLDGALPRADLETAIVRATRVFARRQRTWLRSADVRWL